MTQHQQRGREGALARRAEDFAGTHADMKTISAKLAAAEEQCNLLAAASSAVPPVGCAVAFTALRLSKEETYSVGGGKYGVSASALMRIAGAMRISWDGMKSGRIDDGSDPRVCAFRSVGHYRALDGQVVWVTGEVELDLRDGSDQVEAMRQRASSDHGFDKQLRDTRMYILRHAETKAKARAIRQATGIRSYTEHELHKAFVIPTLVFTGRHPDPEVAKALAIEMGKAMISSGTAMYGAPEPPSAPTPSELPALPPELDDYDRAEPGEWDR